MYLFETAVRSKIHSKCMKWGDGGMARCHHDQKHLGSISASTTRLTQPSTPMVK